MIKKDQRPKPVRRSKIRKLLGRQYFTLKRYGQWIKQDFATEKGDFLTHEVFTHSSQLIRPLKGVDMEFQYNKVENLKLAIPKFNGVIIRPKQTFSFWYLVGKPSKKEGYKMGFTLENGQVAQGIGGGLCQLGNMLFWMALHSPLKVQERWRHGYDVFPDVNRKLPFGSGATLAYNYIDLQFYNPTDSNFQFHVSIVDDLLKGRLLSDAALEKQYTVFEKDHRIVRQFWGGYTRHNEIWRKVISKDESKEEFLLKNDAIMMYDPLLEPPSV